jgi:hypothetical protein
LRVAFPSFIDYIADVLIRIEIAVIAPSVVAPHESVARDIALFYNDIGARKLGLERRFGALRQLAEVHMREDKGEGIDGDVDLVRVGHDAVP